MQPEIFALRYQIYCLEYGFLDPEECQDGLETDAYDTAAAHFTARNRNNELVGSLRLVHPPHSTTFPFENHCFDLFENVALPPREESAEVSRLVVRKDYRSSTRDSRTGYTEEFTICGPIGPAHRLAQANERLSSSPEILLGLYREIYQYSVSMGIRYWYAAMEGFLVRSLSSHRVSFTPIGLETDYYGPVTPDLMDLRDLERGLGENNPKVLAWLRGEGR
jgi:N-acyl amino acid synthase of PEP-CTERM/exosortase system